MLIDTVCVALSAGGLGIALLTAYRKRFLAAARIAAYALIPIGLAMTGILDWIADLVFDPTVWLGFAVLGLSWLLFTVTRAVERRRAGELEAGEGTGRAAVPSSDGSGRRPLGRGKAKRSAGSGDEDLSDIEAILKKHGI
ncbi:hypothetical protein ACQUSR_04830 [Streptomyces sp. P1-3]|uniref:hypothetical protein n=1 Tax=Streptomyces sp. P1-3 TaxID=3421658 RepID=UPI003D35B207